MIQHLSDAVVECGERFSDRCKASKEISGPPVVQHCRPYVFVLWAASVHLVYPHVATIAEIKSRRAFWGFQIVGHFEARVITGMILRA